MIDEILRNQNIKLYRDDIGDGMIDAKIIGPDTDNPRNIKNNIYLVTTDISAVNTNRYIELSYLIKMISEVPLNAVLIQKIQSEYPEELVWQYI